MATLTAHVEQQGTVGVVRVAGYLSSESGQPLEAAFQEVASNSNILLVFQEKDFINSAGLAVLFDLILPLKEKGKVVRVVHPAKHFRKVFDIVGLSQTVEVFGAEGEAMEGWR